MPVLWHFGCRQKEWRVSCCIGRFVLRNSWNKIFTTQDQWEQNSKAFNEWFISYFRSHRNQRRLWCTFWAVQERKPYLRCFLAAKGRIEWRWIPAVAVSRAWTLNRAGQRAYHRGTICVPIHDVPTTDTAVILLSGFSKKQDGGWRRFNKCRCNRRCKGLLYRNPSYFMRGNEVEILNFWYWISSYM